MSLIEGNLLRKIKGFYEVMDDSGQIHSCKIKGSLFQNSKDENQGAPGDRVRFEIDRRGNFGLIHEILPRKNLFSRRRTSSGREHILAANIDQVIIFTAYQEPEFKKKMVVLMLTGALLGKVSPIVLLNKKDLADKEMRKPAEDFLNRCRIPFIAHSNLDEGDRKKIIELLEGKKTVLSGHSGVGKSSLVLFLFPEKKIRIATVNPKNEKGKHTTTNSDVYFLNPQTWIIDTPGIKEFQPNSFSAQELADHFPLLSDCRKNCKFRDCLHKSEPHCGIKSAVETGEIATEIYELYLEITGEFYG